MKFKNRFLLSMLGLAFCGCVNAHIQYYYINTGGPWTGGSTLGSQANVPENALYSGVQIVDPCGSVSAGVLCQSINDVTRFGWYHGTKATLGDSHYVTSGAEALAFHLSSAAMVNITESNYSAVAGNPNPVLSTALNPAFSLYAGLLVEQSHDDLPQDPLNPINSGTFVKLPSPTDSAQAGHIYVAHDGYRDTAKLSTTSGQPYQGQFDAFANWSMAAAGPDYSGVSWKQINYIASIGSTPCSGPNCTQTFNNQGQLIGGHVLGNNGSSETLTIFLPAGDYTIIVGGESGNCLTGAGGTCSAVNGGSSVGVSAARLYATTTVQISPATVAPETQSVPMPAAALWVLGCVLLGISRWMRKF